MRYSEYADLDYGFGQQVLVLRTASDLTQSGLAELLGVSRQAVVGWEAGSSRPSPHHLKHLIELCLRRSAFHSGQEAAAIRALWQSARTRVSLAETWPPRLLDPPPASPRAPAPLPGRGSRGARRPELRGRTGGVGRRPGPHCGHHRR